MLSAQMITTALDVRFHGLSSIQEIYAPILNPGEITIGDLLTQSNNAIIANPYVIGGGSVRSTEEDLKNTLDSINNNNMDLNGFPVYFIQPPGTASCGPDYSSQGINTGLLSSSLSLN